MKKAHPEQTLNMPLECSGCRKNQNSTGLAVDPSCLNCQRIYRGVKGHDEKPDMYEPVPTTVKITRFRDVPPFTRQANWRCNFGLKFFVKQMKEWIDGEYGMPALQINPDFQRGHVWTQAQQTAYMEFILRGGTSGLDIYLNCPSWHGRVEKGDYNDFVVVDGLQRYTAIEAFLTDKIPAFGSLYSEYTDELDLARNTLVVHVNDLKSKAEVLRWYIEMNAGGTPHSDAEIARVRGLLAKETEVDTK